MEASRRPQHPATGDGLQTSPTSPVTLSPTHVKEMMSLEEGVADGDVAKGPDWPRIAKDAELQAKKLEADLQAARDRVRLLEALNKELQEERLDAAFGIKSLEARSQELEAGQQPREESDARERLQELESRLAAKDRQLERMRAHASEVTLEMERRQRSLEAIEERIMQAELSAVSGRGTASIEMFGDTLDMSDAGGWPRAARELWASAACSTPLTGSTASMVAGLLPTAWAGGSSKVVPSSSMRLPTAAAAAAAAGTASTPQRPPWSSPVSLSRLVDAPGEPFQALPSSPPAAAPMPQQSWVSQSVPMPQMSATAAMPRATAPAQVVRLESARTPVGRLSSAAGGVGGRQRGLGRAVPALGAPPMPHAEVDGLVAEVATAPALAPRSTVLRSLSPTPAASRLMATPPPLPLPTAAVSWRQQQVFPEGTAGSLPPSRCPSQPAASRPPSCHLARRPGARMAGPSRSPSSSSGRCLSPSHPGAPKQLLRDRPLPANMAVWLSKALPPMAAAAGVPAVATAAVTATAETVRQ